MSSLAALNKFNDKSSVMDVIKLLLLEGQVYIVGGALRDILLQKSPKDIDIATDLLPQRIVAALFPYYVVIPDEKARAHGIVRVVDKQNGKIIDIATLRKDIECDGRHAKIEFTTDYKEDQARRDFTINSFYMQITSIVDHGADKYTGDSYILDPYTNGYSDITDHIIRFIGDPNKRIEEDALRMIRACRFSALDKDWKIEESAVEAIRNNKEKILNVSKERIRDEIVKSLSYDFPSNFWRSLQQCNLIDLVFPELAKSVGCIQNEHHLGDPVWDHVLRCLEATEEFDPDRRPLFRLAVLLHDIAKPKSKTETNGKINFHRHEVIGVDIVTKWMTSLHFSNKEILYVTNLVKHHQWRFNDNSKDSTIRRWLRDVGRDMWQDVILLRCCDRKGNLAKKDLPAMTREIRQLWEKAQNIINNDNPLFKEDLAINGHDLIAIGILPGPLISQIQNELLGLVWNDPKKNNKEILLTFVEKKYGK